MNTYSFFGAASRSHRTKTSSTNTGSHAFELSVSARFLPTTPPDQRENQPNPSQPPPTHQSTAHAAQHAGRMARRARGGRGVPAFWWRAFGKKTTWQAGGVF